MKGQDLPLAVVTGAAGFIGSHLVEGLLRSGYRVRALARPTSEGRIGHLEEIAAAPGLVDVRLVDILDAGELERAFEDASIVFHLAAQTSVAYSFRAPALFVQTNITGTMNVLQSALRRAAKRVVIVSSSEVYGGCRDTGNVVESDELQARSPYAATKIAAEHLAQSYWHSFGLPIVVVRPFNTFGPRQSTRAVIPWIVAQALASSTVTLGNRESVRDLVFVSDTVDGVIAAAEAHGVEGGVFNLATGHGVSVETIVHRIETILGKELTILTDPSLVRSTNSEIWHVVGDSSRAKSMLHWAPRTSLDDGLSRVVEHLSARSGGEVPIWKKLAAHA